MCTAETGPAGDLGRRVRAGVETAFDEANRLGGVRGRTFTLTVRDDAYKPSETGPLMRELVADESIIGIVGNVGTPTAAVSVPVIQQHKIPFIGAYSGAPLLRRQPLDPWIFNFRAGYDQEFTSIVDGLIDSLHVKPEEIAFFSQRDLFGDSGYDAAIKSLRARGLKDERSIVHARYERNTLDVETCVADMINSPVEIKAVVMIGVYKPSARFIQLMKQNGLNPLFVNISFVGAESLLAELGQDAEGVLVTQVVPQLCNDTPSTLAFRAALCKRGLSAQTDANYAAFEGYLVGRMIVRAIDRYPQEVRTRDDLRSAMESLGNFNLGKDLPLKISPKEHQANNRVWLSVIRDHVVECTDWDELASGKKEHQ